MTSEQTTPGAGSDSAEFRNRFAAVTGGYSGIGRAAAELLRHRGADVTILGLPPAGDAGEPLHDVQYVPVDVTSEAAVEKAIAAIGEARGLDVLVTSAGIQRYGNATGTSTALWKEVLDVNLTGAFLAVRAALPYLRRSDAGAVVLVSSVLAFVTQNEVAAYSTSKAALNGLTRSLGVDEAPNGVRVNAVCPASVDTPMLRNSARTFSDGSSAGVEDLIASWGRMHPMGRVARPAEVAEAIAFLASPRASFITGTALAVDGGLLANAAVVLPE